MKQVLPSRKIMRVSKLQPIRIVGLMKLEKLTMQKLPLKIFRMTKKRGHMLSLLQML